VTSGQAVRADSGRQPERAGAAQQNSDSVLERTRVREVAGVFHSRAALDAAAEALLEAGFDRADIDIIGDLRTLRQRLGGVYVAAEDLADVPQAPRRPFFSPHDIAMYAAVVGGTLAAIGGMAVAYWAAVSGARTAVALGAAAIAACAALGVIAYLITRGYERDRTNGLEWLAAARGLVLWVRVHSSTQEEIARTFLSDCGAEAIRVHEITIEKRPEDLPLGSLRPDPWLGPERLGQP
jgi:hypothetical protein